MEAGVEEAGVEEAGVEEAGVEEAPPVCLLHRLPHLHRQHWGREWIAGLEVQLYAPKFYYCMVPKYLNCSDCKSLL